MTIDYQKIITSERRDVSSVTGRSLTEELASDRVRILYSAPFRRLTQKTQVFPLESNATIRNRAIHSLEVSDVGRWIAYYVTNDLINKKAITSDYQLPIMYAVENACLLHDIGNPPFGHFGESAIKEWFTKNWESIFKIANANPHDLTLIESLAEDFLNYDGNPQGLRIILRLQTDKGDRKNDKEKEKGQFSLNLTYTTILSFLKYVASASEIDSKVPLKKKAGCFESEKEIIKAIKDSIEIDEKTRYPLAYIMEASDDISYCISDIEDGIEKEVIKVEEFFEDLKQEWKTRSGKTFPFSRIPTNKNLTKSEFLDFKTAYVREAIQSARKYYIKKENSLLDGTITSLFSDDSIEHQAIETLKSVARRKLYRSWEAENPELAGYEIVKGLLDSFRPLMELSRGDFETLCESKETPSKRYGKGLDLHWRLINKLSEKHFKAYKYAIQEYDDKPHKDFYEWYLRVHLIIDYISGMTDRFALEQYQLLKGIRLL